MAQYVATAACFHRGHYFRAGETAEFAEGETVPHHFQPVDVGAPEEVPSGEALAARQGVPRRRGR